MSDLVGSTALVERLGDARAGEIFRRHDRLARDLLEAHGGQEIDKSDGFLLLFDRPLDAVRYALAYHAKLRGLDLSARLGIHLGEVVLTENPPEDVRRGAKPLEVEGLAKPFAARLMSVARGGQTLLTRAAFDLARRAAVGEEGTEVLQWLAHGRYTFKGVEEPVEVYEAGLEGLSPLAPPADGDKVRRVHSAPSASGGGRAVPLSDLVGSKLGDFRLERRIGAGGMGVVYEALDESLQRTVALKLLPGELTDDPRRRERFLREARAAAAVTHPNVATVYQVGTEGELVYIAMELVQGQSLRERLAAGPLPGQEALRVAVEIGRGLARAHEAGVVHRDLKPDNVMLGPDGLVKLLDFGLAKRVKVDVPEETATELGIEGRIAGTPGYMSPEQCRGKAVDARSDIFALGVLLYEMLTGQRPFRGEAVLDTLIATSRDPHRPASELRPEVPEAVDRLLDRCLAKAPEQRLGEARLAVEALRHLAGLPTPSSATGDDLQAVLESIESVDTPVPSTPRTKEKSWRPLWIGVVVAVAALAGAGLWLGLRAPPAAPLAAKGSVLACPLLEASGVPKPAGWLGATAAHLICQRATVMLGGDEARTLIPAQLLDLPGQLTDDYPRDPFCAADARKRSIAAARERAVAWLDGKVTARRVGFELSLRLMTPAGEELARADGGGRELYQAARSALDKLAASKALPRAERIDERISRWTGIGQLDLALAVFDWEASAYDGLGLRKEHERLKAHRRALGLRWPMIQFHTSLILGGPFETIELPPADRSSAPGRMWTALARSYAEPKVDRGALADELATLRQQVKDRRGQAELANAEAHIRRQNGDNSRVRSLALSVLAAEPRWADWSSIAGSSYQLPGFKYAARAYAAWRPTSPDTWNMLNYGEPGATMEQRLHAAHRAVILAPDLPLWSVNYATALIHASKPERARFLAGRLSTEGPHQQAVAETILTKIDSSEARFQSASSRAKRALMKLDVVGLIDVADLHLMLIALQTAEILGQETTLVDAIARRFVLSEPHRLAPGHFAAVQMSETCARASPPVASRCFSRLRALIRDGFFVEGRVSTSDERIDGFERYSRQDFAGAVAAWRPLVSAGSAPPLAAIAFDKIGEHEIASKLDAKLFMFAPMYHGATLAHVREARRAAARKDLKRARALARTVIDAWSVADAKVPAVDEMRGLLETLGSGKVTP